MELPIRVITTFIEKKLEIHWEGFIEGWRGGGPDVVRSGLRV
jgi:hypothetical protein